MNGRELERFSIPNLLKCENRDSGEIICGYGILWGQPSSDLGGFVRMFMPGCFTESLASQEVRYLYAHDDDQIYGRTANGTLKVTEDEKGLWVGRAERRGLCHAGRMD
jgi:HK97 family phage prohead protease